jgi:2-amino-4-hydroxy-6-hydroxymethyldihydropteridine diphosphokinase
VPHPGLHQRDFVIIPLAEIAGNLNVPGKGMLSTLTRHVENHALRRLAISS